MKSNRWTIVGTTAALGVTAAVATASLGGISLADSNDAGDSVVVPAAANGTAPDQIVNADASPESANSPNESAADSPAEPVADASPESADSPNESAADSPAGPVVQRSAANAVRANSPDPAPVSVAAVSDPAPAQPDPAESAAGPDAASPDGASPSAAASAASANSPA